MVLKHPSSETLIHHAVSNRQNTLNEMMKSQTKGVDEVKVRTEDNVVDSLDPAAMS